MAQLLEVRTVTKRFGGLEALRGVNLAAGDEILGLIGPNGAGKTTLFNIICGFLRPTTGEVVFEGRTIQARRTHEITQAGIARTFQIVKPFGDLSVLDNILSGLGCRSYPTAAAFTQRYAGAAPIAEAREIAAYVGVDGWLGARAGNLPIGLQRRLEIARALGTRPRLLLLDEPAAGLTAGEAEELAVLVRRLREQGITVIVIEHNMVFAMGLCQRVVVLAQGQIIAQGTPAEIQADERVINAYLGL
ncbi:MAG TPA: ABC transporter ATP-binding protein [Anaerolineae bacterium]